MEQTSSVSVVHILRFSGQFDNSGSKDFYVFGNVFNSDIFVGLVCQVFILRETGAKGNAFFQLAGIGAAAGIEAFALVAGDLAIGVQKLLHKLAAFRDIMRFIGVAGNNFKSREGGDDK